MKSLLSGEVKSVGKYSKAGVAVLNLVDGDGEHEIEFSRQDRLRRPFQLMQEIGMPLTVKQDGGREAFSYFGARAFVVESFSGSDPLIVKFTGSAVGEFLRAPGQDLDRITELLTKSRDENRRYWFSFALRRNSSRHWLLDILHEKRPIRCDSKPPAVELEGREQAPISMERAARLHRSFPWTDPRSGGLTGIPFLFISDGCQSRCHEMCRLLQLHGVESQKVWAFADDSNPYDTLRFRSIYHPACEAEWSVHCAPVVMTVEGMRVLDPSVSRYYPLTISEWYSKFKTRTSNLLLTSQHLFSADRGLCRLLGDSQYRRTNEELTIHRINLRLMTRHVGAPPYADCF